jgi:MoxR-like ATPase
MFSSAEENSGALALIDGAEKIIRGKRDFLELLTACVLAKGHALLEDNPGTGKTTVAKTFAALIGGGETSLCFKRIQFTPDLLPYDITGVDVFDPQSQSFRFVPGPVLSNIVLADEINRSTPKVQSALLEVMAERQVTIGNNSHRPPEPFFVIATENPIESEGTFPLPAAELDRFMVKLSLGYPERDAEVSILEENPAEDVLAELKPIVSVEEFLSLQQSVRKVFCHKLLKEAIVDLVRETRSHRAFSLGASPRAALHLLAISKSLAFLRGRSFVIDEDISHVASAALAHRLKLRDVHSDAYKIIRELTLEHISAIKT